MVAWSRLVLGASQKFLAGSVKNAGKLPSKELARYMSSHNVMQIRPSNWQWTKLKDYFHFYIMLGVIPLTLITVCANVFIGPATLTEIPEGYVPQHYEYYKSPITRFIARYISRDPQEQYERHVNRFANDVKFAQLKRLRRRIEKCVMETNDLMTSAYNHLFIMHEIETVRKDLKDKQEQLYRS